MISNTYNANTDALTQTSMTSDSKTMTNNYTYADDLLTNVSHNAPSGSVSYDFEYNSLGWSTGVQLTGAAQNLATYSLQARTGRLNSLAFGNGQTISYSYDSNDLLKKLNQGTTDLYAFEYDNSGNLGYLNDLVQDKEYWYEYDSLERLGKIRSIDSSGNVNWSQYGFNTANNLSSFKESILGTLYETTFGYDDDSRPESATFGTFSKNLTYDSLGLSRLYESTIRNSGVDQYKTRLTYAAGDGTTSADSYRIATIINGVGKSDQETLTYSYDERGYITKVAKDTSNYSDYRYDGFGQLIRENYQWNGTSYSMVYNYDVGGSLTSKVTYAFVDGDGTLGTPTGTIAYVYGDSTWKDKLTSYNGVTINYDAIGNPTSDGTWTYTWTQGRKLQQISKTGTTASYKYNSDGVRTEKTVNGVTTVYNVVGGQVTWEKTGTNNPIYHLYDASGMLWGLKYTDGNTYFYVRNAQGDIIKIVDSTGAVKVAYDYDAWGNLKGTTGSMASTLGVENPYRYRGYRFDTESGLYYLQSRYYNPQWGRFVNADGFIGSVGGIGEHNIFSYCGNNPIMRADPHGEDWITSVCEGIAAGIEFIFPGSIERNTNKFNSVYDFGNYLTLGAVDTIKGSIAPKQPLSLQHWTDSACTALMFFPAMKAISSIPAKIVSRNIPTQVISNGISNLERTGSALKIDLYHSFPDIVDNYAGLARPFQINNGILLQLEGSYAGYEGRFEWLIQSGKVVHRYFCRGGGINGIPTIK